MLCRRITHAQHFYAPCAGRTTEEPSDSSEEDSTWSMINEEETTERQDQEESKQVTSGSVLSAIALPMRAPTWSLTLPGCLARSICQVDHPDRGHKSSQFAIIVRVPFPSQEHRWHLRSSAGAIRIIQAWRSGRGVEAVARRIMELSSVISQHTRYASLHIP